MTQEKQRNSPPGRSRVLKVGRIALIGSAIAFSALSLACSVFNLTHDLSPTVSLGCAYFAVRLILEFGPRLLSTSRKLLLATVAFCMVSGHALIGTAIMPRDHGTLESVRLLVCALGFFAPELIVWALATAPPIHGTYRVGLRKPLTVPLPKIELRDIYELRLSGQSLDRLVAPDYISVAIQNAAKETVQELGIVRRSGHVSSVALDAGSYTLVIQNHSHFALDILVEVFVRQVHLV